MDDESSGEVRLGEWLICSQSYAEDPAKIAIYRVTDGGLEGGDFDRADFMACVAKFYGDRF